MAEGHEHSRGTLRVAGSLRRTWWVMVLVCAVAVLAACVPPPEDPGSTTTTTEPGSTTTTEPGSTTTTTVPDTTTTTVPDTTTSSTTTSTTTTTTTTVPEEPGEPEVRFDFESDSTLLTEPGQSVDVVVGGIDDDGEPTDDEPEGAVTYEVLGDTGAYAIDELDGGGLRVTSTGEVGGIVVAARVPGQQLAVATEIFTADPADDAQIVADDTVVFPLPTQPDNADPRSVRNADTSAIGPGTFTWDEIRDRIEVPDAQPLADPDLAGDGSDLPGAFDGELVDPGTPTFPFVLRGPAPPVGTKLLGVGSGLGGVVVDRPGLPSVERGGYSLVSVRTSDLVDLYDRVRWEIPLADAIAAGIVPESYEYSYSCPEGSDPDDCADPQDAPVTMTVAPPAQPRQGRSAPARAASVVPATGIAAPAGRAARAGMFDSCDAQWKTSIAQAKPIEITFVKRPNSDLSINIGNADPRQDRVFFYAGYYVEAGASMSGTFQPAASAGVECVLKELGHVDFPVPAGPATGALSVRVKAEAVGYLGMDVEGGPSMEFKLECKVSHRFRAGFGASYDEATGSRLRNIQSIWTNDFNPECSFDKKSGLGANAAGLAAKLGFKIGAGFKVPIGLQVLGKLSGIAQQLMGDPDLGFFEIASLSAGPRIVASVESDGRALARNAADSAQRVEFVRAAEIGKEAMGRISSTLGLDPATLGDRFLSYELSIVEQLATFHEPVSVGADHVVDVLVDGEPNVGSDGVVEVVRGDQLRIESEAPLPPAAPAPVLDSVQLWTGDDAPSFAELEGFDERVADRTATATATVTAVMCDDFGENATTINVLGQSRFTEDGGESTGSVPAWLGKFRIRCVKPKVEFERESVSFRSDQTNDTTTVGISSDLIPGENWSLRPGSIPSWLEVDPAEGTFDTEEDYDLVFVELGVNCDAVSPKRKVSTTLTVVVHSDVAGVDLADTLPVEADCRDTYIEADPTSVEFSAAGGSQGVQLPTDGPFVVYWESTTGADGVFQPGYSVGSITITAPPQPPSCDPKPKSWTERVRTEPRVDGDTTGRGSVTIPVRQDAGPLAPGCDPPPPPPPGPDGPTGGASGDPHIRSFDGLRYDAQTKGEYWYVAPTEGGPDVKVLVRHEPTGSGITGPTVVTGVAAEIDGHVVEVLSRSTIAPLTMVRVDGEVINTAATASLQISDQLTFTRVGSAYRLQHPDIALSVIHGDGGQWMNVDVTMADGAGVRGLLGTPDGDPSDDLIAADGTSYTLAEIRRHQDDLQEFSQSWRVTDVEDSLFTNSYAGFAAPTTEFDPATLIPHRATARTYLAGLTPICDVPTGDELDYAVDAIAAELVAGTAASAFSHYTCRYQVDGQITATDDAGAVIGVPGVELRFDDERLKECVTITDVNGNFTCSISPANPEDLEGLTPGGGPDGSVVVDVAARWAGSDDTLFDTTVSFDDLAPITGAVATRQLARSIDIDDLVRIDLDASYRANLDGNGSVPTQGSVLVGIEQRNAGGTVLATGREYLRLDEFGRAQLTRYFSGATAQVRVTSQIGRTSGDWDVVESPTSPGANAISIDVDRRPPVAELTGTLVDANGAARGATTLVLNSTGPSGPWGQNIEVTPAPDGSYRHVVALPSDTAAVTVRASIGVVAADHPSVTVDDLRPGLNTIELSSAYDPPVVVIDGTLSSAEGVPITARTLIDVRFLNDQGQNLLSRTEWAEPDESGRYALEFVGPLAATSARLTARVGVTAEDHVTTVAEGLMPGRNVVDFDVVHDAPTLSLTGTLLDGDGVARPATPLTVTSFDGATRLHESTTSLTPDPVTGEFSLSGLALPKRTTRAELVFRIGVLDADHARFTVDGIVAGDNPRHFDIDQRSVKVLVDGALIGDEGIPLATTTLRTTAYQGATLLASYDSLVTPHPVTGRYSMTREIPRSTDRVQVTALVGVADSDRVRGELTDIRPGLNQLTLDATFVPTWLELSGTMTGLSPVTGAEIVLSGPRTIGLVALDADGDELYSTSRTVVASILNGFYADRIQLPAATASVRLTPQIGSGPPDWVTHDIDVEPADTTGHVLDVAYRPTTLAAGGTLTIGGAPFVGNLNLTFIEYDGDTELRRHTRTATSDVTGAYRSDATFYLSADNARVVVEPAGRPTAAATFVVPSLQAGRQVLDTSHQASARLLRVNGHLELFGTTATTPQEVEVLAWDANGQPIQVHPGGHVVELVPSGPHGAFAVDIPFPETVVSTALRLVAETDDGPATIVSPSYFLHPTTPTNAVWNTHGSLVDVSIELVEDGQPYAGSLFTVTSVRDESGNDIGSPVHSTVAPGPWGSSSIGGFFAYPTFAGGSGVDPVVAVIDLYDGDGFSETITIPLDRGAAVYREHRVVDLSSRSVNVVLHAPPLGDTDVFIERFVIPGEGSTLVEEAGSQTVDLSGDDWDGAYRFSVRVPHDATTLEVTLPALGMTRAVDLPAPGDDQPVEIDMTTGGHRVSVVGSSWAGPWSCPPYIDNAVPLRLDVAGVISGIDAALGGSGSFEGVALLEDELVIPESDGSFEFVFWVWDPDFEGIVVEGSTLAFGMMASDYQRSVERNEDGYLDVRLDFSPACWF